MQFNVAGCEKRQKLTTFFTNEMRAILKVIAQTTKQMKPEASIQLS